MAIGDKTLESQIDFPRQSARRGSRKPAMVADYDQPETSTMPEKGGWSRGVKFAILLVGIAGLWGLIALGVATFAVR